MSDKDSKKCHKKYWIAAGVLLIVSNIAFVYLWKNESCVAQKQFWETYPLLSPDRGYYNQKDLIVDIQPLRDQLTAIGQDQNISIYFEFLNTGSNIAVNKDTKVWPASLMKIPIALAVMKKVENGQLHMDSDFVLADTDKDDAFGNLYQQATGTHFSLEKLMSEMLVNSDNTARNIVFRNIQEQDIDDVLEHLGMEYDYKNDQRISAKKYSIFWESLFASSYLKPENSQKLIDMMSRSSASDFLSQGISAGTTFSHKIGVAYDINAYSDSGIVYVPGRPYILTVMINGHTKDEAQSIMKDISQKAYQYVSQYGKATQ